MFQSVIIEPKNHEECFIFRVYANAKEVDEQALKTALETLKSLGCNIVYQSLVSGDHDPQTVDALMETAKNEVLKAIDRKEKRALMSQIKQMDTVTLKQIVDQQKGMSRK